jgi:hypothetical protein
MLPGCASSNSSLDDAKACVIREPWRHDMSVSVRGPQRESKALRHVRVDPTTRRLYGEGNWQFRFPIVRKNCPRHAVTNRRFLSCYNPLAANPLQVSSFEARALAAS